MLPWYVYPAALCFLCGAWWGFLLGVAYRNFLEFGRTLGRLLAWKRKHRRRGLLRRTVRVYAELSGEIWRLIEANAELLTRQWHKSRY